jgi:hypothetical protein
MIDATRDIAVRRPWAGAFVSSLLLTAALPAAAQPVSRTPSPELAAKIRTLVRYKGVDTFSIMEIQGPGVFSPLKDQLVTTSGVVTLWTADRTGFWIQDPAGDGDPRTSDGLFVLLGQQPEVTERPQVGDLVRLVGRVVEEQPGASLPLTLLEGLFLLEVQRRGQPLPAPTPITNLPNTEYAEAVTLWESLEGMRVSLGRCHVVAPSDIDGLITAVTEANAVPGAGFYPPQGVLLLRSLGGDRVDYNPERILIDQVTLPEKVEAWLGDELAPLVGVVDSRWGDYLIQPESLHVEKRASREVTGRVSRRSGPRGNLRITDYNLAELFDTADDPETFDENFDSFGRRYGVPSAAEVELRLDKFALSIVRELELPDIIVAEEFETEELLQKIGDRVNAQAGTRYRALSPPTSDLRGLDVGILFDAARVELVEHYQMSGPEVEAVFGINGTFRMREPLVGRFRPVAGGPTLTLIANYLKTKRNESPIPSVNPEPLRVTERHRRDQARVVRRFVNELLRRDPDALVMVVGDLGDFQFAEPGEGEHAVGILEGGPGEVPLRNLVTLEEEGDRYSWPFYGKGQVLSHILVSPALLEHAVAADFLHFNSRFPDRLALVPNTPLRAADRDPFEARFQLPAAVARADRLP